MKLPSLSLNEFFQSTTPRLALAGVHPASDSGPVRPGRGGTMLFASGSDDDGYGGYDDAAYDDPPQSTRRAPGAQRSGAGGSGGAAGSGGRQRSVQFQPEERYWTEYLRIALPIIGLLLMIGLFWYWASQLTDDDGDGGEPVTTETLGVAEIITPPSTPEPTQPAVAPPTAPPAEQPASTPQEQAPPPEEEPADTDPADEEPAAEVDGFAIDDPVVINDDGVNLRDAATTEGSTVVTTLNSGDALTILSGPVEADGYFWWEVVVESTNDVGYVAQDFFEAAEVN